jgi:hypothetical protein
MSGNPTSKPVPYNRKKQSDAGVVTTIDGDYFPEKDYDYFARSPGKLTSKPDDTHRKQLTKRAAEHIALVNSVIPKSKLKSPSQRRSENVRKKLRNRDGTKCPVEEHVR